MSEPTDAAIAAFLERLLDQPLPIGDVTVPDQGVLFHLCDLLLTRYVMTSGGWCVDVTDAGRMMSRVLKANEDYRGSMSHYMRLWLRAQSLLRYRGTCR